MLHLKIKKINNTYLTILSGEGTVVVLYHQNSDDVIAYILNKKPTHIDSVDCLKFELSAVGVMVTEGGDTTYAKLI